MADDSPGLLHEYFARAVARWPDEIAVDVPHGRQRPDRRTTTYAELARDADRLAAALHAIVRGECTVGVLLPRESHLLYAAQLAILQAGAVHVCLDPSFPDEHLDFAFADAGVVAVLTDAPGAARLARDMHALDIRALLTVRAPSRSPAEPILPDRLAYLIYTSGTTGRPKAVAIEHRGIANLIAADLEAFDLGPGDRIAQGSSPAYDSSIEETWLALATGATVVVMDVDTARLGPDLVPWLARERITVLCPTPTLLRTMACADPASALPHLRLIYAGGEALPQDLADRWSAGRTFVNGYGPTECSVTVVRGAIRPGEPVTIGRPVPGHTAWVMDENLEPVGDGAPGELCIAGVGLARGYLGRPELTAERFVDHPRAGRVYRTGDLVHRTPGGDLVYLGRIDAQVKLHGHRVELAEIEARLAGRPGVRAAACRVQTTGTEPTLVAFVVPRDPHAPPDTDALRSELFAILPAHMVPARIALLAALPTTIGGKLDRKALPELAPSARPLTGEPPRGEVELRIAGEFARALTLAAPAPRDADFFDLGGDSVRVALLVSHLRDHASTASLTVRDVYEARTVAALASRARHIESQPSSETSPATSRPALVTAVQTAWLAVEVLVAALVSWALAFLLLPVLARTLGPVPLLLVSPVAIPLVRLAWVPCALAVAVLAKRVLIGRYVAGRFPVWSSFHLRHWLVVRIVRTVPWALLQDTVFQHAALRTLGANIGRRVHLHRGVDVLSGGWDLLTLGDDVTVSRDAALGLCELDDGHLVIGAVTLGDGATLDVRAGVSGDTAVGDGALLTALSSLPRGARVPSHERYDGVPAVPAGRAPTPPSPTDAEWPPWVHGIAVIGARLMIAFAVALPLPLLALLALTVTGTSSADVIAWLEAPTLAPRGILVACLVAAVSLPASLLAQALALRLTAPVPAGTFSRFGLTWLRIALRTRTLESAGVWLSGSLFWPWWLRLAGMRIGRGCEISTILDVLPEHVIIGNECFLADGIYLGGPRVHRATVTVAPVELGRDTFLGNHVVVPPGARLPGGVLLGVCTVADSGSVRAGSAWFGHPPFELPRREIVTVDRHLTHEPGVLRYLTRLTWETLRFALPAAPMALVAGWFVALDRIGFDVLAVPAVTLATVAVSVCAVLLLKWLLLGRVRPGQHPLWTCWCSRWDFLYVAWGFSARGALARLAGTLWLNACLRAFGVRIGRRVVLGPGFAQVVDPDMLALEDGATVDTMFQAHSFEDRVLKIDRVRIGRGATVRRASVILYGADVGDGARVEPHSVVMKNERLTARQRYAGCPVRPL